MKKTHCSKIIFSASFSDFERTISDGCQKVSDRILPKLHLTSPLDHIDMFHGKIKDSKSFWAQTYFFGDSEEKCMSSLLKRNSSCPGERFDVSKKFFFRIVNKFWPTSFSTLVVLTNIG